MRYRILVYIGIIVGLLSLLVATTSTANSADAARRAKPSIAWRLTHFWKHPHETDLWRTLSHHFQLDHHFDQPAVQQHIKFLYRHQEYINELTSHAKPYLHYIYSQTQQHHMPAEIALVPMIESGYDPFAISWRGATGLWQMMPGTASGLGVKINWWYDGRRDIIASTDAALKHLEYSYSYFGDWLLALAAYDAGDGTVRAAIRYNKRHHQPTDFWHLHLPKETTRYIPKLLALAAIIEDPHHGGLYLNAVPNQPYFSLVKINQQIELSRIERLSNTDIKTIHQLNPAFRRWATSPKGDHWLLLPKNNANQLEKNLQNTQKKKSAWSHHRIQQGDSLGKIALENHTTVAILKRVNHLKNSTIRIGKSLLIPHSFHGKLSNQKKQNSRITEDKIPGPKRYVHVVKPNENLSNIAARYKVKPSQIRYWNHLSYHTKLKRNQQLVIWKKHKTKRYT